MKLHFETFYWGVSLAGISHTLLSLKKRLEFLLHIFYRQEKVSQLGGKT
jgi:hypothetical protein